MLSGYDKFAVALTMPSALAFLSQALFYSVAIFLPETDPIWPLIICSIISLCSIVSLLSCYAYLVAFSAKVKLPILIACWMANVLWLGCLILEAVYVRPMP
jgi:hypothetical protein